MRPGGRVPRSMGGKRKVFLSGATRFGREPQEVFEKKRARKTEKSWDEKDRS